MKQQKPRIIIWDLETLPNLPEVLKVFPMLSDFPGRTLKATITTIICFGFKVHGAKSTRVVNAWDFPERWAKDVNDDYEVVKFAYEALKDADAIVTQNGKRFDEKFLQTRLLFHGFPPLPKIIHMDTKIICKGNLLMFSNSLKQMATFMTKDKKMENEGWDLWVKVHNREKAAMAKMSRYCAQDVKVLEKIFDRLRPLVQNQPNFNMFSPEKSRCPSCGSLATQRRGRKVTKTKIHVRLHCMDCGHWSYTTPKGEFPKT